METGRYGPRSPGSTTQPSTPARSPPDPPPSTSCAPATPHRHQHRCYDATTPPWAQLWRDEDNTDAPRISISSYHLIPTQALLVRLIADALNAPISDVYLAMTT